MGQEQGYGVTPGTPSSTVPSGPTDSLDASRASSTTGVYAGTVSTPGVEAEGEASSQIKRNIDATRSNMDETIDALSEKLAPKRLLDKAVNYISGGDSELPKPSVDNVSPKAVATMLGTILAAAATKKVTTKAWHYVHEHPVSTGMFAAGLAWMMFEGGDRVTEARIRARSAEPEMYGGSYVDARTGQPYDRNRYTGASTSSGPGITSRVTGAASGALHGVTGAASDALHGVTDTARTAASKVGSALHHTASTAKGSLRHTAHGATHAGVAAKDMGTDMIEKIRENPLPAALIGAGLAWLLLGDQARNVYYRQRIQRNRQEPDMYGGSYVDARTGQPYSSSYGSESEQGEAQDQSSGEGQQGGRLSGLTSSLGETASSAAESVRDAAGNVTSRLRSGATSARGRLSSGLGNTGQTMSHGYEVGAERLRHTVDQYPLAVGGAAFGVGMLLGMLIPETAPEERLIGGTAQQLREKARTTGRELMERGRHAAEATVQAVREEVKNQGLTPSGLAGQAVQAAMRAKSDVQEEIGVQTIKDKVVAVAQKAKETAKQEMTADTSNTSAT